MHGGFWGRLWERDRPALAVLGAASVLATVAWRGTTRPMVDTSGYRSAAEVLATGWTQVTDRTPGYPLVLLATGSRDGSSHLLFAVQLVAHLLSVVLVLDLARRLGVGRLGRTALAALLVAPAVLLRVLYEGTEATSSLLLTLVFWLVLTPPRPERRTAWALAIGLACGASALVRPTFSLLFVPVALFAAQAAPRRARRPDRARSQPAARPGLGRRALVAAVAGPALVLAGGLSVANAVRFDSPGMTPLLPYQLNSRTSTYVQDLPASWEPSRSFLIAERDRALLHADATPPTNYLLNSRQELAEVSGRHGRELDRYVLAMDLELISHHPLEYLDAVMLSSVRYVVIDSEPAIGGLGRPATWAMQLAHDGLLLLFLAVGATVPGLALVGRVDRRTCRVLALGVVLAAYTAAISLMVENGAARLRAPTEPILALLLVVGTSLVRPHLARAWGRHRSRPTEAVRPA